MFTDRRTGSGHMLRKTGIKQYSPISRSMVIKHLCVVGPKTKYLSRLIPVSGGILIPKDGHGEN